MTTVPMGLLSVHRAVKRFPVVGRGLSFAVALSMLFALTPCCEASAAASAEAAPANAVHVHGAEADGHAHDHGAPATPDPCPVWLDNVFHALGVAVVPAVSGPEPQWSPAVPLIIPDETARLLLPVHSVHSPPSPTLPLYLRVQRLLI